MTIEKLCVFCTHWEFKGGAHDWSDITPGDATVMDCRLGHYGRGSRIYDIPDEDAFRAQIVRAESCPDYEKAK